MISTCTVFVRYTLMNMDSDSLDKLIQQFAAFGLNNIEKKDGYPVYKGFVIKTAEDFRKVVQWEMNPNFYNIPFTLGR